MIYLTLFPQFWMRAWLACSGVKPVPQTKKTPRQH